MGVAGGGEATDVYVGTSCYLSFVGRWISLCFCAGPCCYGYVIVVCVL